MGESQVRQPMPVTIVLGGWDERIVITDFVSCLKMSTLSSDVAMCKGIRMSDFSRADSSGN